MRRDTYTVVFVRYVDCRVCEIRTLSCLWDTYTVVFVRYVQSCLWDMYTVVFGLWDKYTLVFVRYIHCHVCEISTLSCLWDTYIVVFVEVRVQGFHGALHLIGVIVMVTVEEGGPPIITLTHITLIIVYWAANVGSKLLKAIVLENKNFKRKHWYIYFFWWKSFIFVSFNDTGNYLKFTEIKIILKHKESGDNVTLSFH